jgi:polysaccharide biosynthesis/export protein
VKPRGTVPFLSPYFRFAAAVLVLSGCTPSVRPATPGERPAVIAQGNSDTALFSAGSQDAADAEKLARLWQSRTREGPLPDYPLGPGDVLEIFAPPMTELQDYTVRISGEGTISLPLIGIVHAGGMNEEELSKEIYQRLVPAYVRNPQIHIFVREYRSRQVAVIGAVQKPGLYSLASGTDTLLGMISLAGGMTNEAAPRVLFFPAEVGENGKSAELASIAALPLISGDPSSMPKTADPVVINLATLAKGGSQSSLALPARPGDTIIVPVSGEVLVEGWVQKPGSYRITPGLTVSGAVVAAGGPVFAADTSTVQIVRASKEGGNIILAADLEKIKRGEIPDVSLQEGDVIAVASSGLKLAPYGIYAFFSSLFRIGASVPVF